MVDFGVAVLGCLEEELRRRRGPHDRPAATCASCVRIVGHWPPRYKYVRRA
jgi:hypothetical protein